MKNFYFTKRIIPLVMLLFANYISLYGNATTLVTQIQEESFALNVPPVPPCNLSITNVVTQDPVGIGLNGSVSFQISDPDSSPFWVCFLKDTNGNTYGAIYSSYGYIYSYGISYTTVDSTIIINLQPGQWSLNATSDINYWYNTPNCVTTVPITINQSTICALLSITNVIAQDPVAIGLNGSVSFQISDPYSRQYWICWLEDSYGNSYGTIWSSNGSIYSYGNVDTAVGSTKFINLPPGQYSLKATTDFNYWYGNPTCVTTVPITINQSTNCTIQLSDVQASSCTTGSISFNVTSLVDDLYPFWNAVLCDSLNNPIDSIYSYFSQYSFNFLAPGTYKLILKNMYPPFCTDTVSNLVITQEICNLEIDSTRVFDEEFYSYYSGMIQFNVAGQACKNDFTVSLELNYATGYYYLLNEITSYDYYTLNSNLFSDLSSGVYRIIIRDNDGSCADTVDNLIINPYSVLPCTYSLSATTFNPTSNTTYDGGINITLNDQTNNCGLFGQQIDVLKNGLIHATLATPINLLQTTYNTTYYPQSNYNGYNSIAASTGFYPDDNYTLIGTNGCGCTDTLSNLIIDNPSVIPCTFQMSGTSHDVTVNGGNDGSIDLTVFEKTNYCGDQFSLDVYKSSNQSMYIYYTSLYLPVNSTDSIYNHVISGLGAGDYYIYGGNWCGCGNYIYFSIQEPSPPSVADLNLKVFIQGLYIGGQLMQSVLTNTGLGTDPNECDSITVELHDEIDPTLITASASCVLNVDGTGVASYNSSIIGGSYYVVVRHRNSIETWSKDPVYFGTPITNFDFTTP
jgi:hypothetical protein